MRDRACVINFEKDVVWVTPLLSDTCINCNHPTCAKRGSPFQATNPNKLALKCGDIVKIGVSRKAQLLQALIALLLPILSAVGGYFIVEPIANFTGKTATEGIKAASVLLCLGITTGIITIITRSKLNLAKPVIVSVIKDAEETRQSPSPKC